MAERFSALYIVGAIHLDESAANPIDLGKCGFWGDAAQNPKFTDSTGASVTLALSGGAPTAHAASHQNGGADELSVAGLSGLLADDQNAVAEDGIDTSAIHDDQAGEINALALKDPPADADVVMIEDSAAGWAKKKVPVSELGGGAATLQYSKYSNPNGFGSTFDDVYRWTTEDEANGSDITYTASAVNGDKWVIGTNGLYSLNCAGGISSSGDFFIMVGTLTNTYAWANVRACVESNGANWINMAWTGYLAAATDVWIFRTGSANLDTSDAIVTICRVM